MTRTLLTLAAFLIIPALGAEPPIGHSVDATRLRELKEVLWPKAYREQDTALLSQILADEFESIDAEGNRSTKAEELDYIRKNKPSYDSFRFEIKRLQIFENRTAIVSGTGVIETKARGEKKGCAHGVSIEQRLPRTQWQVAGDRIARFGREENRWVMRAARADAPANVLRCGPRQSS